MSKKNNKWVNVVYSTNPNFQYEVESQHSDETLVGTMQRLYVSIDRKSRAGKEVTLVEGFVGTDEDLKELGKLLKSKCGVGGTAKDGVILIQGNLKHKVFDILIASGYSSSKMKGGN